MRYQPVSTFILLAACFILATPMTPLAITIDSIDRGISISGSTPHNALPWDQSYQSSPPASWNSSITSTSAGDFNYSIIQDSYFPNGSVSQSSSISYSSNKLLIGFAGYVDGGKNYDTPAQQLAISWLIASFTLTETAQYSIFQGADFIFSNGASSILYNKTIGENVFYIGDEPMHFEQNGSLLAGQYEIRTVLSTGASLFHPHDESLFSSFSVSYPVPEPAPLTLFGAGLAIVAFIRRKK